MTRFDKLSQKIAIFGLTILGLSILKAIFEDDSASIVSNQGKAILNNDKLLKSAEQQVEEHLKEHPEATSVVVEL